MYVKDFMLVTTREVPAEAELISHQLMIRSGMISKLASGLYTWLPLGLRVLSKVEAIIRKHMNQASGLEILMPFVQPASLWKKTGRWDQYGKELARLVDRHEREFCLGPTHEEVVTDIIASHIKSYRQLPITLYQFQTKFRDEIRPRFGIMRAREFLMKDAYSFHLDVESLQATYNVMYQSYQNILTELGLTYRVVEADAGQIGGDVSHEFHILASNGEDVLVYSDNGEYAANLEMATSLLPAPSDGKSIAELEKVAMSTDTKTDIKVIVVKSIHDSKWIMCVLRAQDHLNLIKLGKVADLQGEIEEMNAELAKKSSIENFSSLNPIETTMPVYIDTHVTAIPGFTCPSQEQNQSYINVNATRDLPAAMVADIRSVQEGDISPDGNNKLQFTAGIEVGHIFQNGDKYTSKLDASVQSQQGKNTTLLSGCYGMGVSRIVAAAIEQNHDGRGIIWPAAMAPFDLALIPVHAHKSYRVKELADQLYAELTTAGFDVLYDNRKERPGVMFADMDLIGIPHRIVVSESGIDSGQVEYKARTQDQNEMLALDTVVEDIKARLATPVQLPA